MVWLGPFTLLDSMTVDGSFTLTAGTLDTSASNFGLSPATWINNGGNFVANQSTVTFAHGAAAYITSRGIPFANVFVDGSLCLLQDSMTVTSTMTLTAGTLNTSDDGIHSRAIAIGGSWIKGALIGADATPMLGERVATPDASEAELVDAVAALTLGLAEQARRRGTPAVAVGKESVGGRLTGV